MNEDIGYQHNSQLGVMFVMYTQMPFVVYKILYEGKEYYGTLQSLRIKDAGKTIISGAFHPHLDYEFFEAIDIEPDKFTIKGVIDLKDKPDSSTLYDIFVTVGKLELLSKKDIPTIREFAPQHLIKLRESFNSFKLIHPELNIERALYHINDCIERTEFLNIDLPYKQADIDVAMTFITNAARNAFGFLFAARKD